MSKGKESQLSMMHGLLTRYYINRLKAEVEVEVEDSADSEESDLDDLMLGLSPAELTAMNNFLKQNDITCAIEESDELSELQQQLENKRKRGKEKLASVSSITG